MHRNSNVKLATNICLLQDYLSFRHGHVASSKLKLENPESSVERVLEPPLDEIVAAHLRLVMNLSNWRMLHYVNSWCDVLNWMKEVRMSDKIKPYGVTGSNYRLVKFRKDVCIANTDICELWTDLWIMKFKVFTAVLLKTNLQVCVLFNEKWEDYLVSNGTTWCTLLQSWFDILLHTVSNESAYLSFLSERKAFTVSDLRACS